MSDVTAYLRSTTTDVDDGVSIDVLDCVNWMTRLDEVPAATALPSLAAALMKTGDVLYMPAGYMTVDKACGETNVFLRLA